MSESEPASFEPDLGALSLKRRSLHGVIATGASQGAKFVLQFGSQIAMAHLLDPAQFGVVAMVYPVLGFVQVFNNLGLSQAIIQSAEISAAQLTSLFWISLGVSVGLAAVLAGASPLLGLLYHEPRVIAINAVLAVLIVVSGLSLQPSALLNRQMRFTAMATIETISTVTSVVAGIGFAWFGFGYWSLVLAQVISSVSYTALLWVCVDWRPSWPSRAGEVGSMLRIGGHVTGSNIVSYLNSCADNMIVGAVKGSVALGVYDRSYRLVVTSMQQLIAPVGRVAFPLLSRLHGSDERYREAYLQLLEATLFIVTPALVFGVVAARPLILTLLGARWSDSVLPFTWMCVSAITIPVVLSTFWLLVSQNRTVEQLRWGVITSLLNIAAHAIGIRWGVVGVSQAAAVYCWGLQLPLLIHVATRTGCVRPGYVIPSLLTFLAAAGVEAAALHAASALLGARGFVGLGLSLALGYAAFAATLVCLPPGRRFLGGAWAQASRLRRAR